MPSTLLDKLSRRAALGVFGSAAATAITAPLARAQPATPADDPDHRVFTMFVQTAHGGTFLPKPGEPGVYELTLEGATAQTIYFSDRPDRIVGSVPTETFLEVFGVHAGRSAQRRDRDADRGWRGHPRGGVVQPDVE